MRVKAPRNYPGSQDKSFREYQYWVIAVSDVIGPKDFSDDLTTLIENLMAESAMTIDLAPQLARIEKKIDDLLAIGAMEHDYQTEIAVLNKKISSLEAQLAMAHDYRTEIDALAKSINDLKTSLAMEK